VNTEELIFAFIAIEPMMGMHRTLLFLFAFGLGVSSLAQVATGSWTDHLSYNAVEELVVAEDKLFAATGRAFFSYDLVSGELERFSKVNGLSDLGVITLGYNTEIQRLLIGYSNGNVDLMGEAGIVNIPDIAISNVLGDKGIYNVEMDGSEAWLSCGFGIVILDLEAEEVRESFFIAPGGGNLKVNDILLEADQVFAATDEGLLVADRNTNLADFANWELYTDFPEAPGIIRQIERWQGELTVSAEGTTDGVWVNRNGSWQSVPGTPNFQNKGYVLEGDRILTIQQGFAQLRASDLSLIQSFTDDGLGDFLTLESAVYANDRFWLGDGGFGILDYSTSPTTSIRPDGPLSNDAWQLDASAGQMIVSHGAVKSNWDNVFSSRIASALKDGVWQSLRTDELVSDENVRDVLDTRFDPFNADLIFMSSWNKGLVRMNLNDLSTIVLNEEQGTAPIDFSLFNPERIKSAGLAYDLNGNLWVSNSDNETPLHVRNRSGNWFTYECSDLGSTPLLGEVVVTDDGMAWVVRPRGNGLFVYDSNGTLGNTSDDDCGTLGTGIGNGDLPTNTVFCVTKDLDGEIWVGTSEGPVVHFSPSTIFGNNPQDFQQILIEQDGNVEVLLGNQSINTIAVDGADRKWMGTQGGGAFLLSPEGTDEIIHFTAEDSPLLSNNVLDIAIDPLSGEVYFATDQGVVSYRSDATAGGLEAQCLDVYPNPVRPEYRGPITIDGLLRDSDVKITDVAGNIVFQMSSNGGRAVWFGQDFSGNRVSTGVYFALVNGPDAEQNCVSKILLIH
jgi:ligand-binding sensor domain-containing protein